MQVAPRASPAPGPLLPSRTCVRACPPSWSSSRPAVVAGVTRASPSSLGRRRAATVAAAASAAAASAAGGAAGAAATAAAAAAARRGGPASSSRPLLLSSHNYSNSSSSSSSSSSGGRPVVAARATMPPSSSQQQQQQATAPPPNGNGNNNNGSSATIATTAAAATAAAAAAASTRQQQQQLAGARALPPMLAPPPPPAPAGSPTPLSLLSHPSLLKLSIQTGADGRRSVVLPDGTPLIDGLSPDMPAAAALPDPLGGARDGLPLVLGLHSPARGASPTTDAVVGALRCQRFLSCARNKLWWMTPEWGADADQLPGETQFLLVELGPEGKGPYGLLLPLIDGAFRATLRPAAPRGGGGFFGGNNNNRTADDLLIRVESGSDEVIGSSWGATLLLAAGTDPYALVDAGVAAAAALSGGARPRRAKRLPASLDVFGWCTWDAFYSTVSARGLAEGLASLAAGGVRARTLIVDDGWQMTEVDAEDAKPATQRVAERLHAPEQASALLEATSEDYFTGKARALREAADQLSLDQEVRNMMPTVANVGEAAVQHHHGHHVGGGAAAAAAAAAAAGASPDSAAENNSNNKNNNNKKSSSSETAPLLSGRRVDTGDAAGALSALPGAVGDVMAAGVAAGVASASGKGAGGSAGASAPAAPLVDADGGADPTSPSVRLVRLGQRLAGALLGVGTAAFLAFYQVAVEPAPPDSLRVRAFAALAQGALRGAMLGFYASASDFTRRLTSVRANGKFARPDSGAEDDWDSEAEDLRSVVASLRARFGVEHVYCWHGMPAYWGGVMPDAPGLSGLAGRTAVVFPTPTRSIAEVEPSLLWSPAVLAGVGVAESPDRLYRAMHEYLASAGVDGVKVDCQAGVGLVGSRWGGGPAAAARFHAALESSIAAHFPGNHAINCMCHSTENLYRHAATPVARASDDFYPRDPASSTPHLAACAFNSLFMGALVQPDWDMFQSAHPAACLHALARAVSGAAVYVSDKPGAHDFELLRRLVLPDGSVFRARLPGRPTRSALFRDVLRDGRSALTVWNANGGEEGGGPAAPGDEGATGVGVVGAFNLQGASWDRRLRRFCFHDRRPAAVTATVRAHDVETLRERAEGRQRDGEQHQPQRYAAFVQGQQSVRAPLRGDEALSLELAAATAEVVWFAPLHAVPVVAAGGADAASSSSSSAFPVEFAALGLAHMYNGGGAVLGVDVRAGAAAGLAATGGAAGAAAAAAPSRGPSSAAVVQVRGAGDLVMYASARPRGVWVDLAPRDFAWEEATGALRVAVAPAGGGGGGGGGSGGNGNGSGDRDPLRSEVEVLF